MSESLFHFGDLSLDEHQRVLLRNGRRVPLPAKALSTLLVLVRNSGCIVEKAVLLEEVWPNEYVEEGNISQNIYILRKALGGSTESHSYIETIPRRGYRFVAQATESRRRVHAPEINSIAVLPFEIASNEPNLEYLSTGITESIMNNLSRIEKLKVMARSSVFQFKGADPQEAGERLGVQAVLVGAVQKVEERFVICAELVNVKDGSQIWGEHYHRSSADILLLQEEVGWEISENLRFRLIGKQAEDLSKPTIVDSSPESYLKACLGTGKQAIGDSYIGVEYFLQAITDGSTYPLANVELADHLILRGLFGPEKPQEIMPLAKKFAIRAIQLDEKPGEAYASLGQIRFQYDWDWAAAAADFQRALRLSPSYPSAHQWYGEYLTSMGLFDEGLAHLEKALELDPLSPIINTILGLSFYFARRYDLAIKQLKHSIELESNSFRARLHLGMVYERKLMWREAISELEEARAIDENPWTIAALGHCHASFEEKAKAEMILEELIELSSHQFVSSATIAVVHSGFRDRADQVIGWLEKAYQERCGPLIWLKVWPIFDHLRSDDRFVRFLRRFGFDSSPEGRRHGAVGPQKPDAKPQPTHATKVDLLIA